MMGGYKIAGKGIWFTKKFNLRKHTRVTLTINAIAIDSWDNEYFKVDADGKNIMNEKFLHSTG